MSLLKKLLRWCPQPKTRAPASFTRLYSLILVFAIALVSALLLTVLVAIAFLPSMHFLNLEQDGWVTHKEVKRVSFPGGDIVVRHIRYTPSEEGYMAISIDANINSEENLIAYANSRTNALNTLLGTVTINSTIEAVLTFRDPLKPEELVALCETSVEKLGEYAVILTDETTNTKNTEILWFPRPQDADFTHNLTSIKEGSKLEGIIAFECYIKTEAARSLQSDPRVLLIDSLEDPEMLKIKKNYESKGFYVQLERPFSQEMWAQYVKLEH